MLPRAKSDASFSTIAGRSRSKSFSTGGEVNSSTSILCVVSISGVHCHPDGRATLLPVRCCTSSRGDTGSTPRSARIPSAAISPEIVQPRNLIRCFDHPHNRSSLRTISPWFSPILACMTRSSMNASIPRSSMSRNIRPRIVAGALINPSSITMYSKSPYRRPNAVFHSSCGRGGNHS